VKKPTLKDGRGDKKKAEASKEFNWAMLYMNVSLKKDASKGEGVRVAHLT